MDFGESWDADSTLPMKHLWTPWRMEYIGDKSKGEYQNSCVFCHAAAHPDNDVSTNVIARSSYNFAMLNRYPYTFGHTMLIPIEHAASMEDMSSEALADLMSMSKRVMRVLRAIADPHGFNIGANIGEAAGAGIASHFHFHVVPRWNGDANFLLTVGGTQTVSDTLAGTAQKLREKWDLMHGNGGG